MDSSVTVDCDIKKKQNTEPIKVFISGSCRIMAVIGTGKDIFEPIHSMLDDFNGSNFFGINFLGKFHNTKQHIQFIKWIKDEIVIPDNILTQFMTVYYDTSRTDTSLANHLRIFNYDFHKIIDPIDQIPIKKQHIKENFDNCDMYIFEICSLKLYNNSGFQVQFELTTDYNMIQQTEDDLLNDLKIIRNMIPINKKILLQVHFRPNIIHNNNNYIMSREIIFNTVTKFCANNENTYMYDPSVIIKDDHSLYDGDTHFTDKGKYASFEYICKNYL